MARDDSDATRARSYQTQPRDKALAAHPQLSAAYATEDKLRAVAADTKPIAPVVATTVDQMIRNHVAKSILDGQEPKVTPAAIEAVKFQVAYRSLSHAIGDRLQHPEKRVELPAEHRELLVKQAEKAVQKSADKGSGPIMAREIAGSLAILDHPDARNPFKAEPLKQTYNEQMTAREAAANRERTPGKDRGIDR